MRNRMKWKKWMLAAAMTAALSAAGVTAGTTVTAWAIPASGTSVSDNIVVRESAVTGEQIGGLSEGQAVSIVDETTGSDGNTWYQITYTVDGVERTGWVRGDLLETSDESLETTSDAEGTESDAEGTESGAEGTDAQESAAVSLEFETQNGSITLTDIPEDELQLVSDRFMETSLEFEEGTVTALQLAQLDELVADDAAIVDFYYVYGYNEIGESGWYVYNADDGTIQKNLLNMQYSLAETTEEATETGTDFSSDSLTRMAFGVLAVVGLLLLILTIIFSVRYRRLRRILEEELEEDEEPARKQPAEEPKHTKRQKATGERDTEKTGKKAEQPEPVKVKKKTAAPDELKKKTAAPDELKKKTVSPDEVKEKTAAPDKAKEKAPEPDKAKQSAEEPVGKKAGKKAEKKAAAKEAPAPEPMSEIGGVDVMDLDSMDDTDFEALLNRYLEEDMAAEVAETDGAAAEAAQDAAGRRADSTQEAAPVHAKEPAADQPDDYDIPLGKGDDYDIPAQDESDYIDLSKLKMPDDEPEYYDDDDDDDLEFL